MQHPHPLKTFKKPLIINFIMILTFMVLVLLVLPLKYHTSDDVGMVMRVSGISKTGAPSEFIMNSNILLGRFLSGLYKVWPNFDWYPAYLLLMILLSALAINFAALRLRFDFKALMISAVFLVLIISFYIAELNFTTTASLLGIGGAALVLSILFKPPQTRISLFILGLSAILLFILCALLREKSFFLMGGLTFITSIIVLGFTHNRYRVTVWAIIGLSAFGIGCAFITYDRHSYTSDTEMREFIVQKKIKSRFVEYGQITYNEQNRHIFEACDVSENDFMMMQFWFYDTRVENFTVGKIKCLADGFPKRKQSIDFDKVFANVVTVYKRHLPILMFLLALGLLGPRSPPKTALVVCAYIVPALVFSYLYVFYKPAPVRISTPIFGFFATMVLIAHMATLVRQPIKQNIVNRTTYGLVVFVMIFSTGLQMNKRIQSGKLAIIQQNKLQAYVVDLNPTDKDIYLVWTGGTFPAEWASPFGGIRNLFADYHQVGVGTSFNSPLSRAQLRRFNLNNPYLDIVDNEYAKFILYSVH